VRVWGESDCQQQGTQATTRWLLEEPGEDQG